jgi:hypothetical protein
MDDEFEKARLTMDDEFQQVIGLDGPVFAINERSTSGIPAVELDTSTGTYVVLIFTRKEAATKYCYLHRPAAVDNIFELTRKSIDGEVVQVELIKVARTILKGHPEIRSFILNHPGAIGHASYISVEDVAFLGRKKPSDVEEGDDFHSALDDAGA